MIEKLKTRTAVHAALDGHVQDFALRHNGFTQRMQAEMKAYFRDVLMSWYLRGAADATDNRCVVGALGLVLSITSEPQPPVPMRLPCPSCGTLHVDEGAFATKRHHTHSCQVCGETWRPAVVHTVGVRFLPGFKDEPKVEEVPTLAADEEDMHERGYARGRRMGNLFMLGKLLGDLQDDGGITGQDLLQKARELEEARIAAKDVCERLGIDWPGDALHLRDVLDKHIGREVDALAGDEDDMAEIDE